ncbi:hypothetical protein Isop_1242 [Isosphaera pallida ATCC 43644]|uniref:Uncharacterized protein n=1 Tax=Isosphaera pallida (strain ATCC 43644 / DSM 9630 / IS1B) TaxID=575540 RepID=E8R6C7_ISOPI|nr:hypothetical protein Isop_1242 [Isosphaera pallida ATCC 43644]
MRRSSRLAAYPSFSVEPVNSIGNRLGTKLPYLLSTPLRNQPRTRRGFGRQGATRPPAIDLDGRTSQNGTYQFNNVRVDFHKKVDLNTREGAGIVRGKHRGIRTLNPMTDEWSIIKAWLKALENSHTPTRLGVGFESESRLVLREFRSTRLALLALERRLGRIISEVNRRFLYLSWKRPRFHEDAACGRKRGTLDSEPSRVTMAQTPTVPPQGENWDELMKTRGEPRPRWDTTWPCDPLSSR